MKRIGNTSAFTLIELLIVISIMGILSTIIITSLGTARLKAQHNKVVREILNVRPLIAIYFDINGSYGTERSSDTLENPCPTTDDNVFGFPEIRDILETIKINLPADWQMECTSVSDELGVPNEYFAIELGVPFIYRIEEILTNWCIDSNGYSGEGYSLLRTDYGTGESTINCESF